MGPTLRCYCGKRFKPRAPSQGGRGCFCSVECEVRWPSFQCLTLEQYEERFGKVVQPARSAFGIPLSEAVRKRRRGRPRTRSLR